MRIRSWNESDIAAIDALLDPVPDRLFVDQFHALHGPDRNGRRARRTWVLEIDGTLIGAATIALNPVHGGRDVLALEVHPAYRRRGFGRALLEYAWAERDSARPLSGKVREVDVAASQFVTAVGGRTYQRCPGIVVDPRSPDVHAWMRPRTATSADIRHVLEQTGALQAWVDMYTWVHERWSPVTDADALVDRSADIMVQADPAASFAGHIDGRIAALSIVFRAGDGRYDLVAETTARDMPGGDELVAVLVARSCEVLAQRDARRIEFDGHDDDPHLGPALATLPVHGSDPLLLVELQ